MQDEQEWPLSYDSFSSVDLFALSITYVNSFHCNNQSDIPKPSLPGTVDWRQFLARF